jgi:hypothetical protein
MGGLISGILGGGESAGQEAQMQQLKASREAIQAYRPEAMQARLNALSNMSTAYQGANNALETMYGGGGGTPMIGTPGGRQTWGAGQPSKFMGHELPAGNPVQEATSTASMIGNGQPRPNRPPLGEGDNWDDKAAMMLDPIGIFRGLF